MKPSQRGFDRQMVINIFRFIDWVLHLPADADKQIWKKIVNFKENQKMPYLSSLERFATEKGMEQGMEQGMEKGMEKGIEQGIEIGRQQQHSAMLLTQLEYKFGKIAESVTEQITGAERDLIVKWSKNIIFANSLDDVFAT